jgi:hypothetical protein
MDPRVRFTKPFLLEYQWKTDTDTVGANNSVLGKPLVRPVRLEEV